MDCSSILKKLLDHSIELWSLLFLQRAKTLNLANKNKEVVGVVLNTKRVLRNMEKHDD
jgi:hypothetical protein